MPTRSRVERRPARAMRALPLLLTLAVLATAAMPAQAQRAPKGPPRYGGWPVEPSSSPLLRAAPVITETEPNNTPATANRITLGDEVRGVIHTAGNIDLFVVRLEAGTALEIEVFAQREGSGLDSYLELYFLAGDNITLQAVNDDFFGTDSRLRHTVATTGDYIILVDDFFERGAANFTYRMLVRTAPTGPGDPTTLFASGITNAWSTAAGRDEFFVVEQNGGIRRVSSTGVVTSFATNVGIPYDVVIDGFGRLLLSGLNAQQRGVVTAFNTATGQRSTFIPDLESAVSITVGPDGDVYVADTRANAIRRFDPRGVPRGNNIDITGTHTGNIDLAFSPAGVLHYSNINDGVFRVVNSVPVRSITRSGIGGIAFDRDGYLYVGTAAEGVVLYGPSYEVVHAPFATSGLTLAGNVVFGRDDSGAMTARAYGVSVDQGSMRQFNPAGVRAPGFRVGVDLLEFATDSLKRGIMGAAYADTLRVLGFTGPLTWTVESGALPPGLMLGGSTGIINGVPEASGTFNVNVRVTGGERVGLRTFSLTVTRPTVEMNSATNHLLGVPGQLTPELQKFLDLQGNRNGRFDIGDLRAYIRARETGSPNSGG